MSLPIYTPANTMQTLDLFSTFITEQVKVTSTVINIGQLPPQKIADLQSMMHLAALSFLPASQLGEPSPT